MKKILLFAVVTIMVLAFVACSSDESERPVLIMGTSADFPPFQFVADPGQGVIGQYAGIDLSLVARIADELGFDIVVQDQEFVGLLLALQAGSIDFVASGMTIRPDRAETVNFSVPYFDAVQYVIVAANNTTINSVADLTGLRVGAQLGTTADTTLTDNHNNGVIVFQDIIRYNRPVAGVMDLLSGSIDAFVIDAPVARGFATQYPDTLRIFSDIDFFGLEQFGIAFNKNNPELLAQFNSVLSRLVAEGYVDNLYIYYTGILEN